MDNYCIYSNSRFTKTEMNPEHIIPLSLGGANAFTIFVSKAKNSEVNHKVDAKMNNDFLVKIRQVQHGFKGHSGTEPIVKIKKAKVGSNPASWELSQNDLKIYDHIEKQNLYGEQSTTLSVQMDLTVRYKFVAKVALATGYFMFGDVFVNNADHEALRTLVFADDVENPRLDLRFYDEFSSPGVLDIPQSNSWEINKLIASRVKSSGVIWGYSTNRIIAHVFVGSTLLGMVNFSAKVEAFHADNDVHDDFGAVIRMQNNTIFSQIQYRRELEEVLTYLDSLKSVAHLPST